jgi:hypothetical protein
MKAKNGLVLNQFHTPRDHLRSSTSLCVEQEVQLQEDLNSACAFRDCCQSSLCSFWLRRHSHPSFTLPDSSSLQEENFLQKWWRHWCHQGWWSRWHL